MEFSRETIATIMTTAKTKQELELALLRISFITELCIANHKEKDAKYCIKAVETISEKLWKLRSKDDDDLLSVAEHKIVFSVPAKDFVLYFITDQTLASKYTHLGDLRVASIENPEHGEPPLYFAIDRFIFPLLSEGTICLECRDNTFVFPNVWSSDYARNTFAVVFQDDVDPELLIQFHEIIKEYTISQKCDVSVSNISMTGNSEISSGATQIFIKVGNKVSWFIRGFSNFLASIIEFTGRFIRNNTTSAEEISEFPFVVPIINAGTAIMSNVIYVTASGLRFIKDTVLLTTSITNRLTIKPIAAVLSSKGLEMSDGVSPHYKNSIQSFKDGASKGLSSVFDALEDSAVTLASSISNEAVKTISHKFGEDIASCAESGFQKVACSGIDLYKARLSNPFIKETMQDVPRSLSIYDDSRFVPSPSLKARLSRIYQQDAHHLIPITDDDSLSSHSMD